MTPTAATHKLDRRQLRLLADLVCGDDGPIYRTRRQLVQFFEDIGVSIPEPHTGSRRQLALTGLTELQHRTGGVQPAIRALANEPRKAGTAAARIERILAPRTPHARDVVEDVLATVRRRIEETFATPRAFLGRESFRPCFRLTLQDDGSAWLDAYLQSARDPSLVIPLEQLLGHRGSTFAFGRRSFSPGAALTDAMRRAATVYEPISRLDSSRPWTKLEDEEVAAFVGGASGELTRAGFGVVVPIELTASGRKRIRLRMHVDARMPEGGLRAGLDANALADFRWEAALGDETLTPEEFRQIADAKRELVRWRGQWVLVDENEVIDASAVVGKAGTMPLARAAGATLAGGVARGEVVAGPGITSFLDRLAQATGPRELTEPGGFVGALRPYQSRGVGWLQHLEEIGFGGCLADDMGLGKTIMLIALQLHQPRTTLVVCPTSVVGNWERELHRFAPSVPVVRHHGSDRARGELLPPENAIVLTSYGLMRRDRELLSTVEWGRVVLDEAQNIKNPEAQQTRAAWALPARSRLAMTGTPVENRLSDLWSIMQFCNPGLLGPQEEFRERFAGPVERGDEIQTERLRRMVRPFVLRRLKSEVAKDLPEKVVSSVFCPLTPEQATLYRAAADELLSGIESTQGMARRGRILALITALKQICDHPALFLGQTSPLTGRSGKLARLTEMLEEVVAEGEAALVFTQYAAMGRLLKSHLTEKLGAAPLFLHGGTARTARDKMVDRFQQADGPPVFLLSLKAGGTGLNLTRATHVFHYDRWWNPAVEDQATDRTHRIGQTKSVMVHALSVAGTLEERIADLLDRKRRLAERIVGAGEGWVTELTDDELRDLVALSDADVTDLG